MKKISTLYFLAACIMGCSTEEGARRSQAIHYYGLDIHAFDVKRLERNFIKIRGSSAINRESAFGNFTLFYTPVIIDANFVYAPNITCNSGGEGLKNHVVCRYEQVRKNYAELPHYVYQHADDVPNDIARRIALTWYKALEEEENNSKKLGGESEYPYPFGFISYISNHSDHFTLDINGDGCSFHQDATIGSDGSITFKKMQVFICS